MSFFRFKLNGWILLAQSPLPPFNTYFLLVYGNYRVATKIFLLVDNVSEFPFHLHGLESIIYCKLPLFL